MVCEGLSKAAHNAMASADAIKGKGDALAALRLFKSAEQLLEQAVAFGGSDQFPVMLKCILYQAGIHEEAGELAHAAAHYERALDKYVEDPDGLKGAIRCYLGLMRKPQAMPPDELLRRARRLARLVKLHGMDDRATASEMHDISMACFRAHHHEPAALLAETAADMSAGEVANRSNSGSFWSHCAWVHNEAGSALWLAFRQQAQAAWTRCLVIDPDFASAPLSLIEFELTGRCFADAAARARACWLMKLNESERAVCAWLGGIAMLLNGEPESEWKPLAGHLIAVADRCEDAIWWLLHLSSLPEWWQLTEIEAAVLPSLPDNEAGVQARWIHELFLKVYHAGQRHQPDS
jgi:tetratricopeptide (TPR) repeat protein